MDRFEITKAAVGYLRIKTTRPIDSGARNIMAHCPFHTDRTPSMSINPIEGVYRCFSCKRGGSIEGLFREVTGESLYKTLNIAYDAFSNFGTKHSEPEFDYENPHKDIAITIVGDVVSYMAEPLALKYLRKRGISCAQADAMKIRYADLAYLNGTRYEKRIIVPIYEKGKMVSAEGRDITGTQLKCIYPSRSTVNTLYDLDNLRLDEPLFVTEGIMDLALLREYKEFANSTSIFGAALTHRQLYLLKKFSKIIYIPDNDAAGEDTIATLRKELTGVHVLRVPRTYNGVSGIKDVGDIVTKAHSTVESLIKRKWLSHVKPLN